MRYFLARFSFSFLILGLVCVFEAYQASHGRRGIVPASRAAELYTLAGGLFVLSFVGAKFRHG